MAANHDPVDNPAEESAVSTRRDPGDSWTSCLDRQNTAERAQIPGKERPIGARWMDRASVSDLCSAVPLVRQNHRR